MEAALYLNHPYGRPVIGWRHEIEKLDREDALAFYRRFYTPNNAILVVAGDVTADEVRTLADETYGKVPPHRRDRAAHAPAGARARQRRAHRHARRPARHAAQPAARYYLVPSSTTARAGRRRGARRARAHPRPRLQQPALSAPGDRQAASRSAPAPGTTARALDSDAPQRLRLAEARHEPAAARGRRSTPCSPRSSTTA